jgi:rubrerythrin
MKDLDKLAHLIEHWIEHNAEHEKTYLDWAARAEKAGKPALAETLRRIAAETRGMEELFRRARDEV